MRQELQQTLLELEGVLSKVKRKILSRANQFRYTGSNSPSSHSEAQETITKYFWSIFCPFHPIEKHWEEDKEQVWGQASPYLKSYGNSLNALSIACNSVEGGLRAVLDELTQAYINNQCKNRIGVIISDYFERSTPEELAADSREFLERYKDVLPPDKLKHKGAYIRARYFQVLKELPFILEQAKVR